MSILLRTMMARMAGRLIYEGVISSGDLHIATKDGEAMFFHDSIDFSAYAGTDGGSTPYRLVFTDSAGKNAVAYGGAAGGGEALGSELITNGDMETGDPPDGWGALNGASLSRVADERTGGAGSYSLNVVKDSANLSVYQSSLAGLELGRLYKLSAWCKCITSGAGLRIDSGLVSMVFSGTSWAQEAIYSNYVLAVPAIYFYVQGESRFDDVSAKALTDIPATGLHLMSAKNGTTRNMTSVETGFDPNLITGVKIYG